MAVNKVILLGNLGADPEVKQLPNGGVSVVRLSIATSERWKDKTTGEAKERTEWHRVEFFGRQAEVIGEYFRKGSQIYIEGSLQTDKWTDKESGVEKYMTKIRGMTFSFVDRKGDGPAKGASGGGGSGATGGGAGGGRLSAASATSKRTNPVV